MPTPINLALYRYLMAHGATEPEAEAAARLDASELATKADLTTAVAEVKGDLKTVYWMLGTLIALQIALGFGNLWLSFSIVARLPR